MIGGFGTSVGGEGVPDWADRTPPVNVGSGTHR